MSRSAVLGNIWYDRHGVKEDGGNRAVEAGDHREKKSKQKRMREDEEKSEGASDFLNS